MPNYTIYKELENLLKQDTRIFLGTGKGLRFNDRITGINEDKYVLNGGERTGFIENIRHLVRYSGDIWVAILEED